MSKYNNIDSKTLKPIHEGKPFIKNIGVKIIEDNDGDISYLTQDYSEVKDITERELYLSQDKKHLFKCNKTRDLTRLYLRRENKN